MSTSTSLDIFEMPGTVADWQKLGRMGIELELKYEEIKDTKDDATVAQAALIRDTAQNLLMVRDQMRTRLDKRLGEDFMVRVNEEFERDIAAEFSGRIERAYNVIYRN